MPDTARTLDVEGARLTYDVRGSGPLLLLIPGGPADAGAFAPLVAHEPPVIELLEDRDRLVAQTRETYDTYRAAGPWPAMGAFMAMTGIPTPAGDAAGPPDPQRAAAMEAMRPNLELFLGHMLLDITCYVPDLDALRAAPGRVVVAAGTTSGGQTAYRAAHALARALSVDPVTFPGDHGGYAAHPVESAEILGKVLTG